MHMKTSEEKVSVLKECSEEIQHSLDERSSLITESLKKVYEYLQEFTSELNETIKEKQERLNTRLSGLFEEIEGLEKNVDEVEEFLHKISIEISKFIDAGSKQSGQPSASTRPPESRPRS